MKVKNLIFLSILSVGLSLGSAFAQVGNATEREVPVEEVDPLMESYTRGMKMPEEVSALFDQGKVKEALTEYLNYKKGLKDVDPFYMLLVEQDVYSRAHFTEPSNATYTQQWETLTKQLKESYGNKAEVIALDMPNNATFEQLLDIANKMIEVDSTYLPAYEIRGNVFLSTGKIKEF